MLKTPGFLRIAARMVRLIDAPWWVIPGIVLLNVLAFVSEGFGIYLLIPLVTTLGDGEGGGLGLEGGQGGALMRFLHGIADYFAGPWQTEIIIALMVFSIFMRGVFWMASRASFHWLGSRIGYAVRQKALQKLLLAPQSFVDSQPPGRLLNILSVEAANLAEGVVHLSGLVTHGVAVLTFFALMMMLSVELTLVVAVCMTLIMGAVYLITSRARRLGKELNRKSTTLSARISETLAGLRTIRLFNREADEQARFDAAAMAVRWKKFEMSVIKDLPQPLIMLFSAMFIGGLVIFAGAEMMASLVVFLVLLQRMQPQASRLMSYRVGILTLAGSLDQVKRFLDDVSATPLIDGHEPAPAPKDAIRLENVRFRYDRGDRDALAGVSFAIPVGKTTALVGRSGSGKSTILSLICRYADPQEGAVTVDGTPLTTFRVASWRKRIAVVPQDVFLFDASIRENISYGREGATDDEIEEVARIAGAQDFIAALPNGLDTRLGDRGSQFSGGQRQRIALARALIARPDLLILDEATNALDNLSARLVQDAVQRASEGRTVLVVAHRLAAVRDADHIVVLDEGRVVEQGSPVELMRSDGVFARLVRAEEMAA